MIKKLVALAVVFLAVSCAKPDNQLVFDYNPATLNGFVLSQVPSKEINLVVNDTRTNPTQVVGYTSTDFGSRSQDVIAKEPVTETIRRAVVAVLTRTQHRVTGQGGGTMQVDVNNFWIDLEPKAVSTKIIARVAVTITVKDFLGNQVLRMNMGVGHNHETAIVTESAQQTAMNNAIEDLMQKIGRSENIRDALSRF
jgi:uncharacterized lipoprotein YajG